MFCAPHPERAQIPRRGCWLTCLFLAVLCYFVPATANATLIYSDATLQINLGSQYILEPCLTPNEEPNCFHVSSLVEANIRIQHTEGYHLDSELMLLKHMNDSAAAMQDIPNIRVRQTRIFSQSPIVGFIELERSDEAAKTLSPLHAIPLLQSALLIPSQGSLYQVFVYTQEQVHKEKELLLEAILAGVELQSPKQEAKSSTLTTLRIAIIVGACTALLVIVFLQLSAYMRMRKRRREQDLAASTLQDLQ